MIDFTSALYLGLHHPSWSLPAFPQLTLGKPAALESLRGVDAAQQRLASLTGCDRVSLGPSTFHLFWDVLRWLTSFDIEILIAAGSYPIAEWALDPARARGVAVRTFAANALPVLATGKRPVIITDGFFPARSKAAPLRQLDRLVRCQGGMLVVDDTQALGIFGDHPGPAQPFGIGGGGSLRAAGLSSRRVLLVSSLAKAFGVPIAMVGGDNEIIREFEASSATRVHCSPASAPVVAASLRALDLNGQQGDHLREQLAQRVTQFRSGLSRLGLVSPGGLFPVQQLNLPARVVVKMHHFLQRRAIRTVLHKSEVNGSAAISFVLTARHRSAEIDRALVALSDGLRHASRTRGDGGR